MTTLLIRCEGPMQSWGTRSRFTIRDTEREPSKSGVVGMLAAALGRSRDEPLDDLAALTMAVRVDRPGQVEVDYQTALSVAKADGSKPDTVLSHRHYLADASFLVGLEGDAELLHAIHEALRRPRWPLFLGRKGHVPGAPPYVPNGVVNVGLLKALASVEWPEDAEQLDAVVECAAGEPGDMRQDVPLSFAIGGRRFGRRFVRRITLSKSTEVDA